MASFGKVSACPRVLLPPVPDPLELPGGVGSVVSAQVNVPLCPASGLGLSLSIHHLLAVRSCPVTGFLHSVPSCLNERNDTAFGVVVMVDEAIQEKGLAVSPAA